MARTPRRASGTRIVAVVLFAVAVAVAGGAAALGEIDSAPIWLVAGAAGLAALVAGLVPELTAALRKGERKKDEQRQAAEQLDMHLHAIRRRYLEHMSSSNPFERHDPGVFIRRLVRQRAEPADRVGSLPELVQSLAKRDNRARRLLLLGEGGAGKTTSLLQLAAHAAQQAKDSPDAPIPVYVELSNFDASDRGFDRVHEMAANAMLGVDKAGFDQRWRVEKRPLLLILDGLNEQRGDATACVAGVRELTGRKPHISVIGSRLTAEAEALVAAPEDGFRMAELLRLEPGQVERFLGERLYASMNEALRALTRNPFMLMALVEACADLPPGELPTNRGQLFRRYVDEHIYTRREPARGHDRYPYEDVKKPLLAVVAERMTAEGKTVIGAAELDGLVSREKAWSTGKRRGVVPRRPSPADFRGEVVANGVVRPAEGGLEFMHQSVQEYFTAVALEREPIAAVAGRIRPLIWRHIDVDKQDERGPEDRYRVPVIMLSGLLETSDELVEALAPRHPLMAAECAGAAERIAPALTARLQDEWLALLSRASARYRGVAARCLAAARLSGGEVIRPLIDAAVDDPQFDVRRIAEDALDQLGLGGCEAYLAEKVQQPGADDRATKLLVAHAPTRAVRVLLEHWARARSEERRKRAEEALRLIDRATAVEELRRARSDEALGRACGTLLRRLESQPRDRGAELPTPSELRRKMGELGERAEAEVARVPSAGLIELLASPDPYIRGAAADALAARECSDAVPDLVEALSKEERLASFNMTKALRRLAGEDAVALVLERVQGPDVSQLVSVPGPWPVDLPPEAVPDVLSDALQAAGIGRPLRATGGRGQWELELKEWETVHIEEHEGVLTAYRTDVRARMLRAAASIASADRLAPSLVNRLDHEDAAVRATALELLGGTPELDVTAQIAALLAGETSEEVLGAAALALARIGSGRSHELLVDLVARGAHRPGRREPLDVLDHPETVDALLCEGAEREQGERRANLLRALPIVRRRQATLGSGDPAVHDRSRRMLVAAALSEPDVDARGAAAKALRWSAGDPGTAELADRLASSEPTVRARAARALGHVQDDRAGPALAAALATEHDALARIEIAAALLGLGADDGLAAARRALVDLVLSDVDLDLRRAAKSVLAHHRARVHEDAIWDHLVALYGAGSDDELERGVARYLECVDEIGLSDVWYLELRGNARARRGRLRDALADYETAVAAQPVIARLHRARASVLATLGRHADAVTAQCRAVEEQPDDPTNHAALGWHAYKAGDFALSITSSLKALELDPTRSGVAFNLALARLAQGHPREAHASYAAALDIARSLPDEQRRAVVEEARRDLDELRNRQPALGTAIDELEGVLERATVAH